MLLPSEEEARLYNILKNGTKEEKIKARAALDELFRKEMEEKKKNPPPWGDDFLL